MKQSKKEFKSIDEYILSFPQDMQIRLEKIRNLIKILAPDAEEKISYKMPSFFLNGALVWYAGYDRHIGFYPKASGIEAFKTELSKYKYSKGSIQFPLTESLPLDLIKKIVKFRIKENKNITH